MFAIFAEDQSDFNTLKKIVKRISENERMKIVGKGFSGGSELIKDGAKSIRALSKIPGVKKFIVCHDADSFCGKKRMNELYNKVIKPSGIDAEQILAIVPTSELESWILADINACRNVFKAMPVQNEISNPEAIRDAKEHLSRLCRERTVPKYSNATHNAMIAEHLDLQKIYKRCPSFRDLALGVDTVVGKQRPRNFWSI